MGYSRRILNYPKTIVLSDLTYMKSMVDPMVISMETLMIYRVLFGERVHRISFYESLNGIILNYQLR